MKHQDRKSFIKTLGLLGAGTLLVNRAEAGELYTPKTQRNTPPAGVKRSLRVAHLTDIHVKNERVAEYGMAAALRSVHDSKDKIDFILNGGDAIMNAAGTAKPNFKNQWEVFHNILREDSSLPIYHCVGNHDLFGWLMPDNDHKDGKRWALDEYEMTKPYYSFTQNNWKFIVLDSIHGRKSIPGYYGKLDAEQLVWLADELKATPAETHICIMSHIPILAICCLFDNGITGTVSKSNRRILDNNMHTDSGDLIELFYQYKNIRACLSGHIHMVDYVNYLGVDYYCNGAVAGSWWKGALHHFEPSYSVMNFYEDGSTSRELNYYRWQA